MTNPIRAGIALTFLAALLIHPCLCAAVSPRDAEPPPVIDPASVFPDDNAPGLGTGTAGTYFGEVGLADSAVEIITYDQIGGDDTVLYSGEIITDPCLDIASNGDIYVAITRYFPESGHQIEVLRSTDRGDSFSAWGTLQDPSWNESFDHPSLDVVEGDVAALYLVYQRYRTGQNDTEICLISSPLGGAAAAWSAETTVLATADVYFDHPRFATDVDSHDQFFIYVVAEGADATGKDIWFARSVNQGLTFQTPYMLATLLVDDRTYERPDIDYGFGGHLHVTWHMESDDGSFDNSIRYRRASNYAGGGIADWDYWVTMTPTSDGFHDNYPRIEAGRASDDVLIAYNRIADDPVPADVDASFFVSTDAGATFGPAVHYPGGPARVGELAEQPGTGVWMMVGIEGSSPALYTASVADLGSWSPPAQFQDLYLASSAWELPELALDPTDGHRPAALWLHFPYGGGERRLYFDADWKNDSGWPNLEPGFPVTARGGTAPAVADLDLDGDLEIVFSDAVDQVSALHHDGTPVDGWPAATAQDLSDGAVAVGDLNGDGFPEIAVGTDDGEALLFDHDGNLLPGWPATITGAGHPVYVSIGALGPPYHRVVVCTSYNRVTYRSRGGVLPAGAQEWVFGGTADFVAPAAVGDIDDDGVTEVVGARYTAVFAMEMLAPTYDFVVSTGHVASSAPTLGDLDLDGDLEILVPTEDGILLGLDHTGAGLGGNFPLDTGDAYDLSSAALAQIRGLTNPEIVFGSQYDMIHAYYHDGSPLPGYPRPALSYTDMRFRSPTLERIEGTSGDVVLGESHYVDCWDNYGNRIHGWPIMSDGIVRGSPAVADLDADGRLEMAVLSDTELIIIDVNNPPDTAPRSWTMYGHDSRRTGCSDCPEDVATAVGPDPGGAGITRVSFAAPAPNPMAGSTQFSYRIPGRAVVSLEVYDLKGARVATVLREEYGPGSRVLNWNGRDDRGAPLASGQYFARLRVRGPGLDESLTRKIVLLR